MAATALASLLIGSGAVARDKLAEAQRRRTIYGGALDTILLEMGAVDERTITVHLAEVSGLPAPLPERLSSPDPDAHTVMTAADARRLSAAPFGEMDGAVELALHPEADPEALAAWADWRGLTIKCFVVPEVRFRELMGVLYGETIAPRFVTVLGRLMGADRTRQRAAPLTPVAAPTPPPVETGPLIRPRPAPAVIIPLPPPPQPEPEPEPEPDIEITEEPLPVAPPLEPIEPLLAGVQSDHTGTAIAAIAALAERRETEAVPLLIDRLGEDGEVAAAAHAALVTLTVQDFGTVQRRWLSWWQKARQRPRIEWLFEALAHRQSDLRLAASQELIATTGVYFGYHFDLPERDREEARRRWSDWWHNTGKVRLDEQTR